MLWNFWVLLAHLFGKTIFSIMCKNQNDILNIILENLGVKCVLLTCIGGEKDFFHNRISVPIDQDHSLFYWVQKFEKSLVHVQYT